jgi:hypothetical protein
MYIEPKPTLLHQVTLFFTFFDYLQFYCVFDFSLFDFFCYIVITFFLFFSIFFFFFGGVEKLLAGSRLGTL